MVIIERQIDGAWLREPGEYPTFAAARRVAHGLPRPWRLRSIPSAEQISAVMRAMRAIPSERRAAASRANGKRGGRPRGAKDKAPRNRRHR